MADKKYGRQEPTFSTVGDFDYSFGDEAVAFFEGYGVRFTPYQRQELNLYLARNKNPENTFDDYAGSIICVSRPRQTGKSYAARFYALWEALIEGKRVLYTAHNGDTTTEMFKELKTFLENNEALYAALKPGNTGIYNAPIKMGFYFQNGGQIELKTRTKSLSRGRSTEIIIVDEAQELTDAQLEALSPTSVASEEDSQMIALGTPPGPECIGTVYQGWHDAAHEGSDEAEIWWLEWAIGYVPTDIFDTDLWYAYNPGMGWRITVKKMRAEAVKFKKNIEGFAREYLGYWARGLSVKAVISERLWDACRITEEEATDFHGLPSWGVKFSPDGAVGSVAVCLKPKEGDTCYVELIDNLSMSCGVSYFADFLADNWRQSASIVIDGAANASTLVEMLRERKVPVKTMVKMPSAREYSDACSRFYNAVVERKVSHAGVDVLTDSAIQCKRRSVGSSGGWGFAPIAESVDSTPVEAAALAYYGAATSKRNPLKKSKVGY